jgi:Methyltransferase domain
VSPSLLRSSLCTESVLKSPEFVAWAERIRPAWDVDASGLPVLTHRKLWEWLFIIQALFERGRLTPGKRGIGFGVGRDPLASLFASFGCEIVATDLDPEAAEAGGWVESVQYSNDRLDLNGYDLCDRSEFDRLVSFRIVDMNSIPGDLRGFDFSWSACALEHLGSIRAGKRFLVEQMECLNPGGVAAHTTEFNVRSRYRTIKSGHDVLFRRRDVEALAARLRRGGNRIDLDLDPGDSDADRHVDVVPYTATHLKMRFGRFVTTSLGLIIEKP